MEASPEGRALNVPCEAQQILAPFSKPIKLSVRAFASVLRAAAISAELLVGVVGNSKSDVLHIAGLELKTTHPTVVVALVFVTIAVIASLLFGHDNSKPSCPDIV